MTLAGWIFMTVSIGFVVLLALFCFVRVLQTAGRDDSTQAPGNSDPYDRDR